MSVYRDSTCSTATKSVDGPIRAIDFTSDTFCRLVAAGDTEYDFDGASFTPTGEHVPGAIALQCTTDSDCIALGEDGRQYARGADEGWAQTGRLDTGCLFFASCPDDGSCLAVTDRGRAYVYDGAWHEGAAGPFNPQGPSCASAGY